MKNIKTNIVLLALLLIILVSCNEGESEIQSGLNRQKAIEYNNTGFDYALKQKEDSAVYYFTKAIEADSTYYKAYSNRAGLLNYLGKNVHALNDINYYLNQTNDSSSSNLFQKGKILFDLQRYKESIVEFLYIENSIYEIDSISNSNILFYIASNYYNLENNDSSLYYLKRSVSFYDFHRAYFLTGIINIENGNLEQACESFTKAREFGSKEVDEYIAKYCK